MGKTPGIRPVSKNSTELSFTLKTGERIRTRLKVSYYDPDGLAYCQKRHKEVLFDIATDTFDYAKSFPNCVNAIKHVKFRGDIVTIREAIKKWLVTINEDFANKDIKYTTWTNYNRDGAILQDQFGGKTMTELTLLEIANFVYKRRKKNGQKITRSRATSLVAPLRRIYEYAHEQGHVEHNILAAWKPDSKRLSKVAKRKADPFDPKEIIAILNACETDQDRNLFRFAFWSGLRTGELIGLEWIDVDFDNGIVKVRKAFVQGRWSEVKTEAGYREIELLPEAIEALKEQRQHTFFKQGRIFENPNTNKPWSSSTKILKHWDAALKKAGVRRRVAYQTRHTFASMLLTTGEEELWASEQMGHKDKTMIKKAYGKHVKALNPDAGKKVHAAYLAALEE